ncbi:hypothetical protein KAR91_13495 [Candidatus Pacearchaeota archaeon]|nr:hypothetical protein [Candidatus Pacearchaeota archaeon]
MILYYDNYIDDDPLTFDTVKSIQNIRRKDSQYKMPRKLDIAKYALASYKIFPWSKVIIKFDVANEEDREPFIKYANEIFPDAEIITHRSDNQKEYCETIEKICKLDDEWIFYTPNNDHPMITNDVDYIHKIIEKANEYKKQHRFVSIIYTMFSEYCNINDNEYYKDAKIIENSDTALVVIKPKGFHMSGQILHRDLLKYFFCSHDLGSERVVRLEDLLNFIIIPNQLIISPKKEICAHFDGHSNTYGLPTQITPDQVPPLFIPNGFFDNSIKIAYGYPEYRKGWININPSAKYYSFRRKKKITDLKIGLQDIPLFWKDRIKEIDINPLADLDKLNKKRDEHFELLQNPWKDLSYRIHIKVKSFLYCSVYLNLQNSMRHLKRYL